MKTPKTRTWRTWIALAALTLGAAGTAMAQGGPGMGPGMGYGPGHGHGPGMMGGGMMGGMGGMGMAGPGFGRMLDGINATPEQRTQLQQIWQGARTDLQAQREAGFKLREQMQQLFAQPTVDARAVEALRQQMLAQHDAASKRMTQAMVDASRVLTPEQRKTLADRMAQHRALMERHRAEREALTGTPRR